MNYRMLGSTGLLVSEIGFGTIPILQGNIPVLPDYFNLDEKEALAVMNYAYKQGCNLYDTAIVPEYGDAEIKLGKFAASIGRKHIIISDKARFFSGSEMYQAVETSCENLGTIPDLYSPSYPLSVYTLPPMSTSVLDLDDIWFPPRYSRLQIYLYYTDFLIILQSQSAYRLDLLPPCLLECG